MPSINTLLSTKYIKSFIYGYLNHKLFINLNYFCFFIGYARSGHSFIASLLDAHPEACISLEVNTLKLVEEGYNKNQIYYLILNNSKLVNQKLKNIWTGYSYAVHGQYQGRFTNLKVIGDKKGGVTSILLGENFSLYHKLKFLVGIPVKAIHVIRNPIDNISTMILRNITDNKKPEREDYLKRINFYFRKVDFINKIKELEEMEILDVYHEDFIRNPVKELKRILQFIDLYPYPDYINDCSKIVYKEPHFSRNELMWPTDLLSNIYNKAIKYPFLKKYFEN
ncbi:MAG: sulfotransferase [Promethearchaeota archaeon]